MLCGFTLIDIGICDHVGGRHILWCALVALEHVNASYRWIQERGREKSMLTNSMRELTSSRSPGAGKLHFLLKLLVQEVARNCELELLPNRPLTNFE